MKRENIRIFILYNELANIERYMEEICFGIEEEGLPYTRLAYEDQDFMDLATMGAEMSRLNVGIGIDHRGNIGIKHRNFSRDQVLFPQNILRDRVDLRALGANSARLIKGIPFKIE